MLYNIIKINNEVKEKMKKAYIVGEKIFYNKEEAQIYEENNKYNEGIEKYLFNQRNKVN